MSLRRFHLFFVVASIAISLMMAAWGGVTYGSIRGSVWHLVAALGAVTTAGLLALYLNKFIKKTKELGY